MVDRIPAVCGIFIGYENGYPIVEYDCPNCGKTHQGLLAADPIMPLYIRPAS